MRVPLAVACGPTSLAWDSSGVQNRIHGGRHDQRILPPAASVAGSQPFERRTQIGVGWAASEVPHKRAFSDGLPPNRGLLVG